MNYACIDGFTRFQREDGKWNYRNIEGEIVSLDKWFNLRIHMNFFSKCLIYET